MTRVSPRRRCSFSGSAAAPPDRKSGDRHEGRGHDTRFDHHPAAVVGGPDQITEQPNNIIGDGRDRETLHRGLQPELQPRARVHRFQEFLVLLLQFDVEVPPPPPGGSIAWRADRHWDPTPTNIANEKLRSEPLMVAINVTDPLSKRPSISLQEISDRPIVIFASGAPGRI